MEKMKIDKKKLDELVSANYNDWLNVVKQMITINDANDVLDSVILSLYDRVAHNNIIIDNDNVRGYIYRSCWIAKKSKNSPYNRQLDNHIKKVDIDQCYNIPNDYNEDGGSYSIMSVLRQSPFTWWEQEAFARRILEGYTIKEMAKDIGISMSKLAYRTEKVRRWLKSQLKNNNE